MYRERRKVKSSVFTLDDEVKHLESRVKRIPTCLLKMKAERAIWMLKERGQETKLKFIEHPFPRDKYDSCFDENAELIECLSITKEYLALCTDFLSRYQQCKAQPR